MYKDQQQQHTTSTAATEQAMFRIEEELSAASDDSGDIYEDEEDGDLEASSNRESSTRQAVESLIEREARAVSIWRCMVFSCLGIASAVVATSVYIFLRNAQTRDFESGFQTHARVLIDNFNAEASKILEVLTPMANSYTSYALSHNVSFPFVTLPHFALRASAVQVLANVVQVRYLPIIYDDETRLQWEEQFAIQDRSQILESYADELYNIQRQDALYHPPTDDEDDAAAAGTRRQKRRATQTTARQSKQATHSRQLQWDDAATDDGALREAAWEELRYLTNSTLPFQLEDGYYTRIRDDDLLIPYGQPPYLPLWQVSHVTEVGYGNLNDDFASSFIFGSLSEQIIKDPKAALGPVSVAGPWIYDRLQLNLQASQFRFDLDEYIVQPTAFLAVPVFDSFDVNNRTVVAILATNIYWRVHFINVLPPDAVGYTCVLNNSFGQIATFRIDGATNVSFLSREEDLHDPSYDHLGLSANMNHFINERISPRTRSYTAPSMNEDFGVYELFVYPSNVTESAYRDASPALTAGSVAAIFLVTMIAFFLYDRLIERTQALIMERAIKSSEIVASLFPKQVRSRLYQPMDSSKRLHKNKRKQLRQRLSQQRSSYLRSQSDDSVRHAASTIPIADFYSDTTLLFADVSGFNEWASGRKPKRVLTFLERLFTSLDNLAKRHVVFKVETIGDCYLAATGVPEPQHDHAVRMAKFAKSLLSRASQVISHYGAAHEMQIRIGMHSGPITAGILRGQKSRFQIFGDTVNTASRMKSTGLDSRIQLSASTATLLQQAGHAEWMEVRPDKVYAKGKGHLTTYLLRPSIMKTKSMSASSEYLTISSRSSSTFTVDASGDNTTPILHEEDEDEYIMTDELSESLLSEISV